MNRALLRLFDRFDPDRRRHTALWLLELTIVVWPPVAVLAYLQAGGWSWFEQVMLLISFGAIWVTCIDILCTTDVRANEDDAGDVVTDHDERRPRLEWDIDED